MAKAATPWGPAELVEEVAKAITEMQALTQRTAASAEESAAASEELSAQAEHMQEMVRSLETLVGGAALATAGFPIAVCDLRYRFVRIFNVSMDYLAMLRRFYAGSPGLCAACGGCCDRAMRCRIITK